MRVKGQMERCFSKVGRPFQNDGKEEMTVIPFNLPLNPTTLSSRDGYTRGLSLRKSRFPLNAERTAVRLKSRPWSFVPDHGPVLRKIL